jgi:hypothetical protein
MLAFVEIDRQYVEPDPAAAIERLLGAQRGAKPGAVLADEIGEKIAVRGGRP